MKVVSVIILGMLATGLSSLYAQDVITLKTGEEIKAKVEEISSSEVKYKRFDNLNGPTIVIEKAKVFAINYENGTREVFNTVAESSNAAVQEINPAENTKTMASPNTGVYADFVGFLTFGPMVGAEYSAGLFDIKLNFRFPSMGLLMPWADDWEYGYDCTIEKGLGIGVMPAFYTNRTHGGFYAGGMLEYNTYRAAYSDGYGESAGVTVGTNIGYKFVLPFGLYFRVGGILGAHVNTKYDWHSYYYGTVQDQSGDVTFIGLLDLAIGFNFLKVNR
ncbi:MAG: hypothetical protein FWH36_03285 [Lentimicrobiaceae bacterium]|nr:hypothetical protein [Lentimicrobiaceae bacterium]